MKGLMMVGIVLFMTIQLMPSSAQEDCWQKIITCVENSASPEEFQQQCCESLLQEINNERECFCSFKPVLLQNATLDGFVSRLLSLCGLTTSFHAICPEGTSPSPTESPSASPQEGTIPSPTESPSASPQVQPEEVESCWDVIGDCIGNNRNRSEIEPRLNPSSPTFNVTEFLCCPLMQQTAITEKQCFCTINTFVQQNPLEAQNITLVLSACDIIADSVDSLNNFCVGGGTSTPPTQSLPLLSGETTPSPGPAPMMPSLGSMERLNGVSFVTDQKTPGN